VTRPALHVAAVLLAAAGAGLLGLYLLAALGAAGSGDSVRDVAALAGFGASALGAALLLELALARRGAAPRIAWVVVPAIWISAALFVVALACGTLFVVLDPLPVIEPLVAIAGSVAAALVIAGVVSFWAPHRRMPARQALGAAAWGMAGATSLAMILEGLVAATLVAGVLTGLTVADPSLPGELADRLRSQSFLEESGGALLETATVSVAIFGLFALAAPLIEELAKLLGVVLVMGRRATTLYGALVAGAFAGLGFATVESLGYALSAGESWPLMLVLRVPSMLVHVTATAVAACGWYLQRTRGGFALAGFYAFAVLIHAAWNGSIVSIMLASASLTEAANPDALVVLSLLGVFGAMGILLLGCAAWLVLVARRLGRDAAQSEVELQPASQGWPRTIGRPLPVPVVSRGSLSGEV
jgi:RsiW-degrading membrane proteinase PrsW (M82 family)